MTFWLDQRRNRFRTRWKWRRSLPLPGITLVTGQPAPTGKPDVADVHLNLAAFGEILHPATGRQANSTATGVRPHGPGWPPTVSTCLGGTRRDDLVSVFRQFRRGHRHRRHAGDVWSAGPVPHHREDGIINSGLYLSNEASQRGCWRADGSGPTTSSYIVFPAVAARFARYLAWLQTSRTSRSAGSKWS